MDKTITLTGDAYKIDKLRKELKIKLKRDNIVLKEVSKNVSKKEAKKKEISKVKK